MSLGVARLGAAWNVHLCEMREEAAALRIRTLRDTALKRMARGTDQ